MNSDPRTLLWHVSSNRLDTVEARCDLLPGNPNELERCCFAFYQATSAIPTTYKLNGDWCSRGGYTVPQRCEDALELTAHGISLQLGYIKAFTTAIFARF